VSIFTSVTTHVLLDLTAFQVGNPILQINPTILAAPQSGISKRLATRA
jgi:hypothetical protein